jgi:hypothetical protein
MRSGFLLEPGQQLLILIESAIFELGELRAERLKIIALQDIPPLAEITPGKILEDGFEGGVDLFPSPLFSQTRSGGIPFLGFKTFSLALLINTQSLLMPFRRS